MTTILQDAAEINARCGELSVASAYAAPLPMPPAKHYQGCWAEEGKSEWGGSVPGTYATEEEAIEAARSSWGVRGASRPCFVWACPVEEE